MVYAQAKIRLIERKKEHELRTWQRTQKSVDHKGDRDSNCIWCAEIGLFKSEKKWKS